ncbi:hypothetical protein SeMB42_g04081 [Synchytrium endobioticum]|uniref:N-acetyltransferase domain-containing protein n=1 Tax=Synchytrium endobioticum TaxID=286115 RepID=A0A507CY62_9FUNG|nr:hypothetical protein SeLEV6574_g04679 [Synchytrium endobioticum]TPX45203.1 hypothetical protein SeMB42_g04081 [Synchytrium endobioticum]
MDAYLKKSDLPTNTNPGGATTQKLSPAITYKGRRSTQSIPLLPTVPSLSLITGKPPPSPVHISIPTLERKRRDPDFHLNTQQSKRSKIVSLSSSKPSPSCASKQKYEQLQLNFGLQRNHGSVKICKQCLMEYTPGKDDDDVLHERYHRTVLDGMTFSSYKESQILEHDHGADMVLMSSTESSCQKLMEVVDVLNKDLGGVPLSSEFLATCKCIFYVSSKRRILGCVIAEPLKHAFRVIPSDDVQNSNDVSSSGSGGIQYKHNEAVEAVCGICRIWVLKSARAQGIATKLLDCVRKHFVFGTTLSPSEIAFSQPTVAGIRLAERYANRKDFLTYD